MVSPTSCSHHHWMHRLDTESADRPADQPCHHLTNHHHYTRLASAGVNTANSNSFSSFNTAVHTDWNSQVVFFYNTTQASLFFYPSQRVAAPPKRRKITIYTTVSRLRYFRSVWVPTQFNFGLWLSDCSTISPRATFGSIYAFHEDTLRLLQVFDKNYSKY